MIKTEEEILGSNLNETRENSCTRHMQMTEKRKIADNVVNGLRWLCK